MVWRGLVCHNRASLKCLFMIWMMVRGRLSTMDRLPSWRLEVNLQCMLCGEADESHQHIFIECAYSKELRALALRNFMFDHGCGRLDNEVSRLS